MDYPEAAIPGALSSQNGCDINVPRREGHLDLLLDLTKTNSFELDMAISRLVQLASLLVDNESPLLCPDQAPESAAVSELAGKLLPLEVEARKTSRMIDHIVRLNEALTYALGE